MFAVPVYHQIVRSSLYDREKQGVLREEFERQIRYLSESGFSALDIGAFLMLGV